MRAIIVLILVSFLSLARAPIETPGRPSFEENMYSVSPEQRKEVIRKLNEIKRANWSQTKKNHRPTEIHLQTAIDRLKQCNYFRASQLLEVFTSINPDPNTFYHQRDPGMFCTYLAALNYDTSHSYGKTIKQILKKSGHDFIKQKTEEQKEMDKLWQRIKDLLGFQYQATENNVNMPQLSEIRE